ncbi:MAG: hypothetical protein ACRDPT_01770 [Streptomycetales bacterium]
MAAYGRRRSALRVPAGRAAGYRGTRVACQGVAVQELAFVVFVVFVLWAGLFVGSVALGVRIARRVKRRVRARAREVAAHARVRAASYGVGHGAEVARLRLELREAVRATRRVVVLARAAGRSVGDAPSLVLRLDDIAADLDAELELLGVEGGAVEGGAVQAAPELARLHDRVAAVVDGCADLRAGVRGHVPALHDAELADLRDACRIEASALRAVPHP